MLMSMDDYFSATVSNGCVCFVVRFLTLNSGARQFLSANTSQRSVATRFMCARIFNYRFVRSLPLKAKFHCAIWSQTGSKLVADLQRAGIWPII